MQLHPLPDVDGVEQTLFEQLGHELPAAFHELVLAAEFQPLLHRHSNDDQPLDRKELRIVRGTLDGGGDIDVLPFMVENQRVVTWAVALDEDDPRVLLAHCDEPTRWHLACEAFSQWVWCQVWDYTQGFDHAHFIAAQAPRMSAITLASLRERLEEGPTTRFWPGEMNYRFWDEDVALVVWNGDHGCDAYVAARTDPYSALLAIPAGVLASLEAVTEDGAAALDRLQAKPS